MTLLRLSRRRRGQSTVEVMLVISVLVVAIVAAGFVITNENNGFIAALDKSGGDFGRARDRATSGFLGVGGEDGVCEMRALAHEPDWTAELCRSSWHDTGW